MNAKPLTYADAGVDIERGDAFVDRIAPLARATFRRGVLGGLGGFGGLFELGGRFRDPILVSGTDGVGTKLKLAFLTGRHATVGIDLVAMCVNDVLCSGAEPLFFLDYFATGKLELGVATDVVAGIAEGCKRAGCALLGGETAELPGFYGAGEYDLAGFAVAAVERDGLVDGSKVRPGDAIIGLGSSGLHSNGFSLARKALLEVQGRELLGPAVGAFDDLAAELLEPTRIYVQSVLNVLAAEPIHGMAHITGGGLVGNVPRFLPRGCRAQLDRSTWREPAVFGAIRQAGVEDAEMQRTFNLGIGLCVAVPRERAEAVVERFSALGEQAARIGEVVAHPDGETAEADCVLVGEPAA